jgi:hypothetical protein
MIKELLMADRVILTDYELVVTGYPVNDDDSHNCDEMGCGSCEHILLRVPLVGVVKGYNPNTQEQETM